MMTMLPLRSISIFVLKVGSFGSQSQQNFQMTNEIITNEVIVRTEDNFCI